MFVIAAAVCDFCKKKESELYQKEVGDMTSYLNMLVFLTEPCLFDSRLCFKKCLILSHGCPVLIIILPFGGSLEFLTELEVNGV